MNDYNETVAVVSEADALDAAYSKGFEFFEGADPHPETDPVEAVGHLKESAQWANVIAPSLRAMAGHGDAGHGTWTTGRPVVVVPVGNEDDQPAEGEQIPIGDVYDAVIEAFDRGAMDALEGREYGETDDVAIF